MFRDGRLTHCMARKAALIRESEMNRCILRLEAMNFRPAFTWIDRGVMIARKLPALWTAISTLVGAWRARRQPSSNSSTKFALGLDLAKILITLTQDRGK